MFINLPLLYNLLHLLASCILDLGVQDIYPENSIHNQHQHNHPCSVTFIQSGFHRMEKLSSLNENCNEGPEKCCQGQMPPQLSNSILVPAMAIQPPRFPPQTCALTHTSAKRKPITQRDAPK